MLATTQLPRNPAVASVTSAVSSALVWKNKPLYAPAAVAIVLVGRTVNVATELVTAPAALDTVK